MHPTTHLTIAQPCSESWAAMTPTARGRHCAACAKTVVDFTQLSDVEILEHLRQAAGSTCGRFRAGQLGRPLQPLALAPARGWRTWLAAAVAVWGLREVVGSTAQAQPQARAEQHPTDAPQLPEKLQLRHRDDYEGRRAAPAVLRGVVVDASTGENLPGVSVIIHGTTVGTPTNAAGEFELPIPADKLTQEVIVEVRYLGYVTQERRLAASQLAQPLRFALEIDVKGLTGEVVVTQLYQRPLPPLPWHPRRMYYWGKYWLTRPFRSQ